MGLFGFDMYRSFASLRMTVLRFAAILSEAKDLYEMIIPSSKQNVNALPKNTKSSV